MPITYKCPSCGAAMEFDSTSQMLKCAQCGNEMDVQLYERRMQQERQEQNSQQSTHTQEEPQESINMKVYHCQSCGAELMSDEFTSAVICSFCGNPSLVEDRLQGAYKPKLVIPFKINREQAQGIYRSWVKKGKLTPKELSTKSTIEKISGLYVPFWLYDYEANSQMTAQAARIRTSRKGDTEYTYTDHYHVYRDVNAHFERIPADASEKMADDAMDKMEPYDYRELEPFAMPYLSGYLSERYNYTHAQMQQRVDSRVNRYITEITRNTIKGYSRVNVVNNQVRMNNLRCEYALFPVWVLNCRYQNKEFQFMLNGQTGKIVADRPISIKRAVMWGVGIFAATLLATMIGGLIIL